MKQKGNNSTRNKKKPYSKTPTSNLIPSQPSAQPKPPATIACEPQIEPDQLAELNQSIHQLVSQVTVPQIQCETSSGTASKGQQNSTGSVVIKKLGQVAPNAMLGAARAGRMTATGHRQAGEPSSRLKPSCKIPALVLTVSRRAPFSVYLKKALDHLQAFKTGTISLVAMGGAVSMCFSLALALESHLHIGPACRLVSSTLTGTVVVADEITPANQEMDSIYKTRNQASVHIQLSIELIEDQHKSLASHLFS